MQLVFHDFSSHSSPTSMIKELQWTSLEQRSLMACLPWCAKSSMVSLTFRYISLQGLVAAVVIPWHYNKCIAEWSHMKPASSQQQWFHGTDYQPQQWPHQALIPSRPRCWQLFARSHLHHVLCVFICNWLFCTTFMILLFLLRDVYTLHYIVVHFHLRMKKDKYWRKKKSPIVD